MKPVFSLLSGWLLLALLLSGVPAQAQAPAWAGAMITTNSQSSAYSATAATATDASGMMYLAGVFEGTVTFGTITLTSNGFQNMFVAKWDPATSHFLWVQHVQDSGNVPKAIAVQGPNIYVTGSFESRTITFGTTTLTTTNVVGGRSDIRDIFVAKLTDAGSSASWTWAQRAGGSHDDHAQALAVQGNNVYIAGDFDSPTSSFGGFALTPVRGGGFSLFVAMLTDNGSSANWAWAQRAGNNYNNVPVAMASSGTTLYLASTFAGAGIPFGALSLTSPFHANGNYNTVPYVAKLSTTGTSAQFEWVLPGTTSTVSTINGLALSGTNLYLTGYFSSAISFGSAALSSAYGPLYVAKLTDAGTSGSWVWASGGGGSSKAIVASGANVYLAGTFATNTLYIGNLSISNTMRSGGTDDVFLAKLTDTGPAAQWQWVLNAGGNGDDAPTGIVLSGTRVNVSGYVVSDYYNAPVQFGNTRFAFAAGSTRAAFLAWTNDAGLTATTTSLDGHDLTIFPNPAHGRAIVQLPAIPGTATATLTILDALGRTLRTQTAATNAKADLDLTGLMPGLYAVRVAVDGRTATQRLVVE